MVKTLHNFTFLIFSTYFICTFSLPITITFGNITILSNGTLNPNFSKPNTNGILVNKYEEKAEFMWFSEMEGLDYHFELLIADFFNREPTVDLGSSGIVPTSPNKFAVNFDCLDNSLIPIIFHFSFLSKSEDIYIYWFKECSKPGCPYNCDNHGQCNYIAGECLCDDNYFSNGCDIYFKLEPKTTICPFELVTIEWDINSNISTARDWMNIYPSDSSTQQDGLYWFYLGTRIKNPNNDIIASSDSMKFKFYDPGSYIISLLLEDSYVPIANIAVEVLPIEQCKDSCNPEYCKNGVCKDDYCVCNRGYFGENCTLGCDGEKTFTNRKFSFDDGSQNDLIYGNFNCSWIIQPNITYESIEIYFNSFDIPGSSPLYIYDTSENLLYSYTNDYPPIERIVVNSSVRISWSVSTNRTNGYGGFNILYDTTGTDFYYHKTIGYDHPASIVVLVFLAASLLWTLFCCFISIFFKNHYIVSTSSWQFVLVTCIGAIIGFCAIIPMLDAPTPGKCIAQIWLVSLGFILSFGALFGKNYRIAKIFNMKKLRVIRITNFHIFRIVALMLAYEIVFLLIWTFVDFPSVKPVIDNMETLTQYNQCSWEYSVFPILSIFFKVLLMLWGIFISYQTRKAGPEFRESRFIAVAIYNCFLCFIIFVPLIAFLTKLNVAIFVLKAFAIIFVLLGNTIAIFSRLLFYLTKHYDSPPSSFHFTNSKKKVVNTKSLILEDMRNNSSNKLPVALRNQRNTFVQSEKVDDTE